MAEAVAEPLYLLDTNILLHYLRRQNDSVQRHIEQRYHLRTTPTAPLISFVTEAELRAIAKRNVWGVQRMTALEFLLTQFVRVPIDDEDILRAYVDIDAFTYHAGRDMGKNDLWIAATARVTGAILLTTDRDFDHLDGAFLSRDWIDPTL